MATERRACDVHRILDEDDSPREVTFCRFCGKWFCRECKRSPQRIEAAFKHWGIVLKHAATSVADFFRSRQAEA